jgi:nucleoside-diphosphate-sugar epimerase
VYGPRDGLFLAKFLQSGPRLRIFGAGDNEISMVYIDNYCHGLILGERALYPGSPALGKFYIITDGPPVNIWEQLDLAVSAMGYPSIQAKWKVPAALMMAVAWAITVVGWGVRLLPGCQDYVDKGRGPFKINPFAIKMMTIHRSFDISHAEHDLGYRPLFGFKEAWSSTLAWYQSNRGFWDTGYGGSKED